MSKIVQFRPFIGQPIQAKRQRAFGRPVMVNGRKLRGAPVTINPMQVDERGGFVIDLRDRCDA